MEVSIKAKFSFTANATGGGGTKTGTEIKWFLSKANPDSVYAWELCKNLTKPSGKLLVLAAPPWSIYSRCMADAFTQPPVKRNIWESQYSVAFGTNNIVMA